MRKLVVLSSLAVIAVMAIGATNTAQAVEQGGNTNATEKTTYKGKTARGWHWRYTKAHRAHSRTGELARAWQGKAQNLARELAIRGQSQTVMAIRFVFGSYAEEAIRVASCESGLSVNATNGQYLGLFQMGDYARGRYGHGPTAIEQAKYAYAYFVASGKSWGPWECKP
jgi:hypothetical protein